MKKAISQIFFPMMIALAAIISCQRFNEPLSALPGEFIATTEQASTKTSLGEDWSVLWQDSDAITVFEGNTAPSCYKVSKGAGTPSAIFEAVSTSSQGSPLPANIAVYPYDDKMTISTDGAVTLTIPSTQKYEEGGFAPGTNIMVAATSDGEGKSLAFRNVLSIVRVNLTGSDVIKTLEFSGNNNEPLCGKATVKPVFGKEPVLSFSTGAGTKLTLDCGEGVQLSSSEPTCFFFAVPAMEYSKGFKVTATAANGKSMTMTVSKKTVLKRSKVKTAPATLFKGEYNDGFVHLESPELEAYCIKEFDLDGDGRLSEEEASRVTSINLENTDIEFTSLNGIEYFVNLQYLNAPGEYYMYDESVGYEQWQPRQHKLYGTVDLSKNIKLSYIFLQNNEINELILPPSKDLQGLSVNNNRLTYLDVSRSSSLQDLDIELNEIKFIDVSKNNCLYQLHATSNLLTEIDVSLCPLLTYLSLGDNCLTSIDLTNNTKLKSLDLFSNDFFCIDVSMLGKLESLNCLDIPNLKYILLAEGQNIEQLLYDSNPSILIGDVFTLTPESYELSANEDIIQVEALSTTGSQFSSASEWISLVDKKQDNNIITTYTFMVQANNTSENRNGLIVLCDGNGINHTVTITQNKKKEYTEPDWKKANFFHTSLMMRFTATWCSYCPQMAESVVKAKERCPDKIEAISMHASGDLYFNDVRYFESMFGISSYPTGVVDCRRFIRNQPESKTTTNLIVDACKETEDNYPTVTGISFNSSIIGNEIDVDVSVYAKAAEEFKITVLLLEDGISAAQEGTDPGYIHYDVPRLTLCKSILGDDFTVPVPNTIVPLHFSGKIPSGCKVSNCRILVFIQRRYGSQAVLRDYGMGEWYIDNCVSGKATSSVPLVLVGDNGAPQIGENEEITPGDDINF